MKFVDPDGEFEIDENTNTISCKLNSYKDLNDAYKFFSENKQFSKCIAVDNKTHYSLIFTKPEQMKKIISQKSSEAFEQLFSKIADGVSIAQAIEDVNLISNIGYVFTLGSVGVDVKKSISNYKNNNKLGAISAGTDAAIDIIGFFGPEGAYISLGLKYTKKGISFAATEFARASVYIEKSFVNEWSMFMFGVKVK